MAELRLKYTDERGETRRVAMSDEIFTIGRHSENDLCIPNRRLSREHARIERYTDSFYASDSNSSNGTTLNGARLGESVKIKNGDYLNLGGAIQVQIEIAAESDIYQSARVENRSSVKADEETFSPNFADENPMPANNQSVSTVSSGSNSIPTAFLWLAPVFGLVILIVVGLFFVLSGKKETARAGADVEIYTPPVKSPKAGASPVDETPVPGKSSSPESSNGATNAANTLSATNLSPAPKTFADAEKVEQNAAAFLRRIAQNDPKAFLTGKQTEIVNSKINALKGSIRLAENFRAVKQKAAQFETLANSKNLKAQFLATAALTKIGDVNGDPLAVASAMLPVLNDLKITLDNKLADDNLLIIAAYERGAAGKPRSLQSTLEALSKTTQNVSPREIRTIWFLREKGKITETEFDFTVRFLAIGAIMQNPKEFNVNAEAVTFD
jgi:pSer/pThr/pTyr-binding forkhead associated (FHA) protein